MQTRCVLLHFLLLSCSFEILIQNNQNLHESEQRIANSHCEIAISSDVRLVNDTSTFHDQIAHTITAVQNTEIIEICAIFDKPSKITVFFSTMNSNLCLHEHYCQNCGLVWRIFRILDLVVEFSNSEIAFYLTDPVRGFNIGFI